MFTITFPILCACVCIYRQSACLFFEVYQNSLLLQRCFIMLWKYDYFAYQGILLNKSVFYCINRKETIWEIRFDFILHFLYLYGRSKFEDDCMGHFYVCEVLPHIGMAKKSYYLFVPFHFAQKMTFLLFCI